MAKDPEAKVSILTRFMVLVLISVLVLQVAQYLELIKVRKEVEKAPPEDIETVEKASLKEKWDKDSNVTQKMEDDVFDTKYKPKAAPTLSVNQQSLPRSPLRTTDVYEVNWKAQDAGADDNYHIQNIHTPSYGNLQWDQLITYVPKYPPKMDIMRNHFVNASGLLNPKEGSKTLTVGLHYMQDQTVTEKHRIRVGYWRDEWKSKDLSAEKYPEGLVWSAWSNEADVQSKGFKTLKSSFDPSSNISCEKDEIISVTYKWSEHTDPVFPFEYYLEIIGPSPADPCGTIETKNISQQNRSYVFQNRPNMGTRYDLGVRVRRKGTEGDLTISCGTDTLNYFIIP
ncbi:MAG: hypothetical protein ACYTE8_09785 [Planctomycetota bacterium]|jgi:hypothetical protein